MAVCVLLCLMNSVNECVLLPLPKCQGILVKKISGDMAQTSGIQRRPERLASP